MTKDNQPDESQEEQPKWNPLTETREWSAAATELACFALARSKGKQLVKIINTGEEPLPIICIFEDYPDE